MNLDIKVARVKAGHVGQIYLYQDILWESEPFPSEVVDNPTEFRTDDLGAQRACVAATEKIKSVMEGLFQ